jgi:hypothetical protein
MTFALVAVAWVMHRAMNAFAYRDNAGKMLLVFFSKLFAGGK